MGNKQTKNRIQNFLKHYKSLSNGNIDLENVQILDSSKIKSIKNTILSEKFNDIAKGIDLIAVVNEVDGKIIKLKDLNSHVELNRKFYDLDLKSNDIIKCKLEYTILTESFNISECEVLRLKDEKVLKKFCENNEDISDRINYILGLMGINSSKLMFREKLTFITRLISLVIKNYSLLEFSQKGLGKTKTFNELEKSYVADSSETVANLFYSNSSKENGMLSKPDVLVIDEFQQRNKKEIINNLQKYLEEGEIPRKTGNKEFTDTSIVIIGNATLNKGKDYQDLFVKPKENLFENHSIINKEFIDRLNYILPSWGNREFKSNFIKETTKDIVFLETVFNILRKKDIILDEFLEKYSLNSLSQRTYKSIKNTTEGFIKLLNLDENEYDLALYLAVEGRYLIEDVLEIIEGKAKDLKIFKKVLTTDTYKELVSEVLDIDEDDILEITPHEVYYESKDSIVVKALDTIGLEEINLIKKHFDNDFLEICNNDFSVKLDYEDSDELEEAYEEIQDKFEEDYNLCRYQYDDISYLYGYKLNEIIDFKLLRTKRIVSNVNLWCPNKSRDKCEDELKLKKRSLICEECGSKYYYKTYIEHLRKL